MSRANQQIISNEVDLGGILNMDKPAGMTSHDVVSAVRRLTLIRRVGHTGTLDPLATGVLLLCIGRATRLSEYLIGQDKRYEAVVRLGQETNTYDAEGEIAAEKPVTADRETIEKALSHFRGPISQVPPMFSALKKDGQPLYELARKGLEVERPSREVTIYHLDLLDWTPPDLRLDVTCSSGTYIRSLAHDLGQRLGCGGHITALRRTAVGHFSVEEAISLESLTAENWLEHLQPADTAVAHLPAITFSTEETAALQQGQRVAREGDASDSSSDTLARAYDENGLFIGIIAARADFWQPRKILVPY
ncbi:MAG: tRNA pseudouridine(55) synthase TruB [Candidatus Promineifilaceae bacterium]